jgi:predicted anti-sigma-YlaC factor YlaD
MDCEFLERVSLLIDGEMSGEESERVREHIKGCTVCRQAEQEFLHIRQQIRSYESKTDSYGAARAQREITGRKPTRWWGKKIALPAPAFALMVFAMLALLSWSLFARPAATGPGPVDRARRLPVTDHTAVGQQDFSRYDHGERAVIYKARRTPAGSLEQ